MVDRLPDLKKTVQPQRHVGYEPTPFDNEIAGVTKHVESMTIHVNKLQKIINDPKKVIEVNTCCETIDDIKSLACAKLKELKCSTLGNSVEERMNANQFFVAVKKFSAVLKQYDEIIQQQQNNINTALQMFDKHHGKMSAELSAVTQKHQDIETIAQRLAELHQMLVDMAVLVTLQGEMLDSIEDNVGRAEVATEKAVVQVQQAGKDVANYRKKLCGLIIIIMGVLTAIIVPSITLT